MMVLPFVDEHKPKCYICHSIFDTIEQLREHQKQDHEEFIEFHQKSRQPAPGDVTVF